MKRAGVLERASRRHATEPAAPVSSDQLAVIFQEVPDGIMVQDASGKPVYANPALARMAGCRSVDELLKTPMHELYARFEMLDEAGRPFQQDRLPGRRALSGERAPEVLIRFRTRGTGEERCGLVSSSAILDQQARTRLAVSIFHDITERQRAEDQMKASLREKETLLKEVHHRVKNNLQVISSLLTLQASVEPSLARLFAESQHRIRSMALVHQKLYQTEQFSVLDLRDYVCSLVEGLRQSYRVAAHVRIEVRADSATLEADKAIPCGLIVNELVANALEHAFPDGRAGRVRIALRQRKDGLLSLLVSDNGVGMPHTCDSQRPGTLGLRLVGMLVEQLKGRLVIVRRNGTSFRMTFQRGLPPHAGAAPSQPPVLPG